MLHAPNSGQNMLFSWTSHEKHAQKGTNKGKIRQFDKTNFFGLRPIAG